MNPLLAAVAALCVIPAVACCAPAEPAKPAAASAAADAAVRGKLEAPVEIESKLEGNTARITLHFTSPATGVRVGVSGVDGLVVTSPPTLVDGASYDRGAVAAFDVAFTPGPGASALAVAVSGSFGGGHLAKVRTIAVGTPAPSQQKAEGTVVESPGGERVRIVGPAK